MNKKLDPSFMNIPKGRELLPRLVQVSKRIIASINNGPGD